MAANQSLTPAKAVRAIQKIGCGVFARCEAWRKKTWVLPLAFGKVSRLFASPNMRGEGTDALYPPLSHLNFISQPFSPALLVDGYDRLRWRGKTMQVLVGLIGARGYAADR